MPDFHPFVIHFPVGLLVAALLFDLTGTVLNQRDLVRAGWWTQLCGTLVLPGAIITGLLAAERSLMPAAAAPVFQFHQQMAFLLSALFAGLILWRISARTEIPQKSRTLYFLLYTGAVIVLIITAGAGGRLVFEYGVGTR